MVKNNSTLSEIDYGKIKVIEIYKGSFHAGHNNVKIDLAKCKIEWNNGIDMRFGSIFNKEVTQDVMDKFLDNFKRLDPVKWKDKYVDNEILDGTQWSIKITEGRRKFEIYGDNMYPEEWNSFCEMVRDLTDGKFR